LVVPLLLKSLSISNIKALEGVLLPPFGNDKVGAGSGLLYTPDAVVKKSLKNVEAPL
jgi:hypothetical protein